MSEPQYASPGIEAGWEERKRQVFLLGYTAEKDAGEGPDLARAGACYADYGAGQVEGVEQDELHSFWPWDDEDWKPSDDPKRTIAKAIALLAAAYDEIVQAEARRTESSEGEEEVATTEE